MHWHRTPSIAALAMILGLAACDSPEEKEARHYERATDFVADGEHERALVEIQNVLQLNPKNADAMHLLGLIHEREGRLEDAIGAFLQAVTERPEFLEAHIAVTRLALILNDLSNARRSAAAIAEIDPGNPDGLAVEGALILREGGDPETALTLAERARAADPALETAIGVEVGALQKLGRIEEAREVVDAAIEADPEKVGLRILKSALLETIGESEEVVRTYEGIIELQPDEPAHRLDLARFHASEDDPEAAAAVLRTAIDDGVELAPLLPLYLELVEQVGGPEEVIAELGRLIEANPEVVDLRFRLAERQLLAGQPGESAAVLERIREDAETDQTRHSASVALAQVRVSEDDPAAARALLDEVLEDEPEHREASLLGGYLLLQEGRVEEAVRSLRVALRQNPNWPPALRLLADAHLRQGDVNLAIDALANAVEADPTNAANAQTLATLLMRRGDLDAALKVWDQVVRLDRTSGPALQARAEIAIRKRHWSAAAANIDWLLEEPGRELAGLILTGRLRAAQGRFDDSRAAFEQAQVLAPRAAMPTMALVETYRAENDLDGALAYLERRLSEHPDDITALNLKADVLTATGDLTAAIAALRRVIALAPDQLESHLALGWLVGREQGVEAAVEVYESALATLPDEIRLLDQLAVAHYRAGDHDAAIATFERILALDPQNDVAANNLAVLIADHRRDDPDAIAAALDRVGHFRGSSDPARIDTLGWLHYRSGDLAAATTFLERAVNLAPETPRFNYHLGMALAADGNASRAIEHLEKATPEGATYVGLDEARETLHRLRNHSDSGALERRGGPQGGSTGGG